MASGLFNTSAELDIEIGAVEIKDGTTDARVTAKVDNAAAGTPTPLSVGGKYNASAPTYDDGDQVTGQYDVNGNKKQTLATAIAGEDLTNNVLGVQNKPVASASYSPSLYAPLTQVTKNVIKSSAGNVLSIYITNDNAAVRYFQLHNKATAPAAGEAPVRSLKVPAGTANNPGVLVLGREFFGDGGEYFATGIGWAISTTFATFTDSATNTEHIVNVDYV